MFRKTLLVCSVVLPLGLTGTAPALADTDFDVHFGVPFYTYQVGPGYRYYDDYGWYDADRYDYGDFRRDYDDEDYDDVDVVVRPGRLSCGEAAQIVRESGFSRVRARDCDGGTYTFRAKRDGDSYIIYVNSRNGRMWGA